MDKRNRVLSIITLSKKAGKLILGFDVTKKELFKGSVDCVFVCSDLSEKTLKEINYVCEDIGAEIKTLPLTLDEIWYEVGKRAGIMCITEDGLAHKLESLLDMAD